MNATYFGLCQGRVLYSLRHKMRYNKSLLLNLCLTVTFIKLGNGMSPTAVSSLRHLLSKISECDLQIIHSRDYQNQLSFSDLSLVSTTVFMPGYESSTQFQLLKTPILLKAVDFPALNTLRGRSPPCRLSFIFWGENPSRLLHHQVEKWILFASNFYLVYAEVTWPNHQDYFIPNTNAVITLVISKSVYSELEKSPFYQRVFYMVSIIVGSPNQDSFEICFPQFRKMRGDLWEPITITCKSEIYLEERNYISVVEKHRMNWEEWRILEIKDPYIKLPRRNNFPFDSTADSSIPQFALKIFTNANVSFVEDYHCSSRGVRIIIIIIIYS